MQFRNSAKRNYQRSSEFISGSQGESGIWPQVASVYIGGHLFGSRHSFRDSGTGPAQSAAFPFGARNSRGFINMYLRF